MSLTRRQALVQLAGLAALPSLSRWNVSFADDPLDGTIAAYQLGRRRGEWTAVEVTTRALERCRTDGTRLRAIDALATTALDDARASDARLRMGEMRGPLDGVPKPSTTSTDSRQPARAPIGRVSSRSAYCATL
jgi:hypothetical protein